MKSIFSMFQVNFKTADANYLTAFTIHKLLESKFINNPELVRTSLDAKALYNNNLLLYQSSYPECKEERSSIDADKLASYCCTVLKAIYSVENS